MPLYEYQCAACQQDFLALRAMSRADEEARCPACGSADVRRKLSVFAVARAASATDVIPLTAGGCCGGSCGCAARG